MPIYRYQCSSCKLRFELRQSFTDEPTAICPACQGAAQRLFSPVPILFKGPGFYITDSREERKGELEAKTEGKKWDKKGKKL